MIRISSENVAAPPVTGSAAGKRANGAGIVAPRCKGGADSKPDESMLRVAAAT